jgi:hypothetical protein
MVVGDQKPKVQPLSHNREFECFGNCHDCKSTVATVAIRGVLRLGSLDGLLWVQQKPQDHQQSLEIETDDSDGNISD